MGDYRNDSRLAWSRDHTTNDDIKVGCLQRIADATEVMAKEYNRLLQDNKWLRQRAESADACSKRLARSNAALRGQITRLKKAATQAKEII